MNDLISRLSEIRSEYNCFDENEEPYYRALSEAIKILSRREDKDTINRQAAIEQCFNGWNKTPEEIAKDIRALSSAQSTQDDEVTFWKERAREYENIITGFVTEQAKGIKLDSIEITGESIVFKKSQPEPIRINLNEWIKVKLTDLGKEIYYHQYDRINQIAGKKICKPKFPKEDENGYTKFQLWCFIELYGEYMGITLPNVIEPLEIVYERDE